MKAFRSTAIGLVLAMMLGGWIWFNERGPVTPDNAEVLWRLDPTSVQSLQLQSGDNSISLTRRGDHWQVASRSGARLPADATVVQSLLDQIQLLSSDAVTPLETSKLEEYGLDTPQSTLTVNGAQKLEFGDRPSFDSRKMYVRANDRIALLPAALHAFVAQPLNAWRDKAVLRFATDAVTALDIKAPALKASFVREAAQGNAPRQWHIRRPITARADAGTIESFLGALSAAQTDKFLDDNPKSPALWGLDKPIASVKLSGTETQLRIGRKVSGGYAAQKSDSPIVFQLSDATFGLINRPLRNWRSKTPLPIDLNAVSKVEVRARGAVKSFVKEGDRWQTQTSSPQSTLERAPRIDATHEAVIDILFAAQNLVATDFVDNAASLSNFGLDKPEIELVLDDGRQRLAIGRRNNKIYARSSESARPPNPFAPTIYVLDESALQAFETGLNILFPPLKLTPPKSGKVNTKSTLNGP